MQTPPPPPAPPAPAAPPSPVAVEGAQAAATPAQPVLPAAPSVAYLRARRSELSTQLNSASGRREDLLEELKTADPAARPGLEQRLAVLDKRMVQLETDIAENGRLLAATPGGGQQQIGLVAGTAPPMVFGGLRPDQIETFGVLSILFVFTPISLAISRQLWKRGSVPRTSPAVAQAADRLGHLEQAVDAIAIEVERISEGQRFMTRLLSEAQPAPALGQRAAEPVRARQSDG